MAGRQYARKGKHMVEHICQWEGKWYSVSDWEQLHPEDPYWDEAAEECDAMTADIFMRIAEAHKRLVEEGNN